jgi:hypothetical protein
MDGKEKGFMIARLNDWLGQLLYRRPAFFFLLCVAIALILIASFLLAVEILNPSPSCEITERGVHYEFKGDERFYPWQEIRSAKLLPHRIPGRDIEEIFALKYVFDLSGPVCELRFDGRYDLEEIQRVERLVEKNGIELEVVPLTKADLQNMRRYYSPEKMEKVIQLFDR